MAAQTQLLLKGKGSAFTTTDLAAREVGIRTDAGEESLEFENSGATAVLRLDPIVEKGITFQNDTTLVTGTRRAIFQINKAYTVTGVSFASTGGTSIAFTVDFHTALGSGGTTVHSDTCASATPEYNVTPSGTAAVTASRILMVTTSTVTGSVTQLHVTVHLRKDA